MKFNHKCSEFELKILGDFRSLQIIQELADGEKRFCELQRDMGITSPTTLADRLKRLENQRIISKKRETVDKLSVAYSLTSKGIDVLPIIKDIKLFAGKYPG